MAFPPLDPTPSDMPPPPDVLPPDIPEPDEHPFQLPVPPDVPAPDDDPFVVDDDDIEDEDLPFPD